MTPKEYNFLLLTGKLGNPDRHPLTMAQFRMVAERIQLLSPVAGTEELSMKHLSALGLGTDLSKRILSLLEDELLLKNYLSRARKEGAVPITRANPIYPLILRKRLGNDAPGCLWIKGNSSILRTPGISLVGSRDLRSTNALFAREAGRQAAQQGFTLISGNARGADCTAQNACLSAGGKVISIIADSLTAHSMKQNVVYVSEEDFDEPFSALRALRRNRVIHAMGEITFVAQCTLGKGGTWQGSCQNLRNRWSPLFCFRDNSEASVQLEQLGATLIDAESLNSFSSLSENQSCFF